MTDMDPEIFREYMSEVFESLEGLDEKFVALETNPDDLNIVDSIFRPVHSIKGSSAFFKLDHITGFSHKLENLLDDIRKEKRSINPTIIDALLKGTDFLMEMFKRLASGDMKVELLPDEKDFIENLDDNLSKGDDKAPKTFNSHLDNIDDAVNSLRESGRDAELLDKISKSLSVVRRLASDKGQVIMIGEIDSMLGDGAMPQIGVLGDLLVEPDELPKVEKLGDILVGSGEVDKEALEMALANKEPDQMVGDALVEQGVATEEQVGKAIDKQKKEKEEQRIAKLSMTMQKTMRIDEEKVDEFMEQIGELVIISEVFNYLDKRLSSMDGAEVISKEFKNANMNFSELTLRLQHGLSEVRKVAIKGIFQKIPRIVRDIATAIGKDVEVITEGDGIMLDKSLAEKLESPVIHMVRNSVDHGVETPDIRKAAGKPERGTVRIKGEIIGETLHITLHDDGAGLNREKLIAKAIEKGVLNQAQGSAMSDEEVFNLIFHPGFSTAAKVTDISGRGVGMDVVRRAIDDTKGKISIQSKLGEGSTFTISVPISTTLVTINGLIVAIGESKFIFPVEDVKESLRPTGEEVFSIKDSIEMVNIRGDIYPLIRLHQKFSIETDVTKPQDGVCLIIEKNGNRCCVLTDAIVEQQNVVLKDLGVIFQRVKSIMGGAILGDGSIGLVMNVEGLMGEG